MKYFFITIALQTHENYLQIVVQVIEYKEEKRGDLAWRKKEVEKQRKINQR